MVARKSVKKTPSSKKAVVVRRKSVKKTVSSRKPVDRKTQLKKALTSKNAKIAGGAAAGLGASALLGYLIRQEYLKKKADPTYTTRGAMSGFAKNTLPTYMRTKTQPARDLYSRFRKSLSDRFFGKKEVMTPLTPQTTLSLIRN